MACLFGGHIVEQLWQKEIDSIWCIGLVNTTKTTIQHHQPPPIPGHCHGGGCLWSREFSMQDQWSVELSLLVGWWCWWWCWWWRQKNIDNKDYHGKGDHNKEDHNRDDCHKIKFIFGGKAGWFNFIAIDGNVHTLWLMTPSSQFTTLSDKPTLLTNLQIF